MISLKRLMFFSVLAVVVVAIAGSLTWFRSQAGSAASVQAQAANATLTNLAPKSAVSVAPEARLDYFYARQNGYGQVKNSTADTVDIPLEAKLDYFYARQYINGQVEDNTADTMDIPLEAKSDYFYAREYIDK